MATKKQKREAAEAKRQLWLAERRESGLKAQREDRERRANKVRESQQAKHDKKHSSKKRDSNCLLCQDAIRAQQIMEDNELKESVNEL